MRRALALALTIAGVIVLGFVAERYTVGWYRRDRARQQWEAMRARADVVAARGAATVDRAPWTVAGAPVARLVISRIDLDEVVVEGVGDEELDAAPGHLPGSALPGEPGNAVVSAHRDRHFDRLDEVAVGDTVETESMVGAGRQRWLIVSRRVIGRRSPALFQTRTATLTLTTCWPVRFFGPAPERLVLTAKPLSDPRQPLIAVASHRG